MPLLRVIPARLGATRLPQKPLRIVAGEPLIRAVTTRVLALDLDGPVVVATDAREVVEVVEVMEGVEVVLTAPASSGTERVAQVARMPRFAGYDTILNLQGDEPFLDENAVRGALKRVEDGDDIGTAAGPLTSEALANPNRVKVRLDERGGALAFARRVSGGNLHNLHNLHNLPNWLHHIGLYAYTRHALLRWVDATPVREESLERLEQLRPLAMGMTIGVGVVTNPPAPGIDTMEDLIAAEALLTGATQEIAG